LAMQLPNARAELSATQLAALTEASRSLKQVGDEVSPIGGVRTFYAAINDPLIEGPPSTETWAKVKAEFAALADADDADLNAALSSLPVADYRALTAEQKAGSPFSGDLSSAALSSAAPLVGVLVIALAASLGLGLGDPCASGENSNRACIEKTARDSGTSERTVTPLETYSQQVRL